MSARLIRGGSWRMARNVCRSSRRFHCANGSPIWSPTVGFRIVLVCYGGQREQGGVQVPSGRKLVGVG